MPAVLRVVSPDGRRSVSQRRRFRCDSECAANPRRLVLIRHALPDIDYGKSPASWPLSASGRAASRALAADLREFGFAELVSSEEPKAAETACEIAGSLGIGWRTAPGLQEHVRDPLPYFGPDEWHELVRAFFDHPDDLIFGRETANEAKERFSRPVDDVVHSTNARSIAIVTHGTVLSLYAAARTGKPPYSIWAKLGIPDYVVLEL